MLITILWSRCHYYDHHFPEKENEAQWAALCSHVRVRAEIWTQTVGLQESTPLTTILNCLPFVAKSLTKNSLVKRSGWIDLEDQSSKYVTRHFLKSVMHTSLGIAALNEVVGTDIHTDREAKLPQSWVLTSQPQPVLGRTVNLTLFSCFHLWNFSIIFNSVIQKDPQLGAHHLRVLIFIWHN